MSDSCPDNHYDLGHCFHDRIEGDSVCCHCGDCFLREKDGPHGEFEPNTVDVLRAENAALAAKVEALAGLCQQVEDWLGLAGLYRELRQTTFRPWLRAFRALKGKR